MTQDDRNILELLKDELDFIEKGGYGRSVRTPWKAKSVFEDSLSCLNYGYAHRAHPCSECHLVDFVKPEDRTQSVPCHRIQLNEAGETIEALESKGNESQTEAKVKSWLQARIGEIEAQSKSQFRVSVK